MKKVVAIVVAVALIGLALWLATGSTEKSGPVASSPVNPPPAAQSVARGERPGDKGDPAPHGNRAHTSDGDAHSASTLPPLDSPVATYLDSLEVRAKAGDARAACRVAMEKWRCQESLSFQVSANDYKSRPEFATMIRANQERCAGVERTRFNDAWKFLAQSALSGNVAAMSLYGRNPPIAFLDSIDAAEALIIYRDNAERFLTQAIEGGDVMALYAMWWHSAVKTGTGRALFKVDPYRATVYANAALPLLDERRRGNVTRMDGLLGQQLDAAQAARARAEGETLRARYFARSPRALDTQNDAYFLPGDCDR